MLFHTSYKLLSIQSQLEQLNRQVLELLGRGSLDPSDLDRLAELTTRNQLEMTQGYSETLKGVLKEALFDEASTDPVVVKDITFSMLSKEDGYPRKGVAHIAYIPNGNVVGLSKLPKMLEVLAKRYQTPANLAHEAATQIMDVLNAAGVAIVLDVLPSTLESSKAPLMTASEKVSVKLGLYRTDHKLHTDFLTFIAQSKP